MSRLETMIKDSSSSIVREFYEVIEEARVVRSEWELLITRSGAVEFIILHCDMVQALY